MNRNLRSFIVLSVICFWMVIPAGHIFSQNFAGTGPIGQSSEGIKDKDKEKSSLTKEHLFNPDTMPPVESLDYIGDESQYTLGKTDVIEISILRHPEVSGQFVVNNEGKIQYEFIGDIRIEGLKKDEVKKLLMENLSDYIVSPDVTVKIVGYNSKVVYVIGEVGRPGKIYMHGDTITVREALIQAGLPLLSAKATKSRLITPSENSRPERKNINVYKLLYEGDLRENLVMKPGDTLYLPPTIMAKALRIIQPVAAPVGAAASTGRTVTTGF